MNDLALKVFEFEDRQVRVVMKDGEPQFVAKDVAEGIGAIWNGETSIKHVPEEWRGVLSVYTPSGNQDMWCLKEQGIYFYLARSDKPAALPFQKKIAGEILPSIRKHGAYMTPEAIKEAILNPDFIIRLAQNLKEEQAKVSALTAKIEEDRPKVIFADSVSASETAILIGDLAKLIRQNGVDIGQRRLFQWLRENGYLMKTGSSVNMPTQRGMDLGLFEILERTVNKPDGSPRTVKTTKVSGRGQLYFINKFVGEKTAPRPLTVGEKAQKTLWGEGCSSSLQPSF
jgi:anti-repressor protein